MNHDHTKSHPHDQGTPLVSLGQGDYRRDIMPGDVSNGHTRREESKAIDALTRDAMRSGTVPLADSTPPAGQDATVGTDAPKRSVLPTLTPITTQVRKLNVDSPRYRNELARADAAVDQAEMYLADHFGELALLLEEANRTANEKPESRGAALMLRALSVTARRIIQVRRERGEQI